MSEYPPALSTMLLAALIALFLIGAAVGSALTVLIYLLVHR